MKKSPIAFLQLGGGISADFPICVVPSLKHDLHVPKVRDWAGFIEIGSSSRWLSLGLHQFYWDYNLYSYLT